MSVYERISAVVSLTLLGLVVYSVFELPSEAATVSLFNSPLGVDSPRRWLMVLLLTGLALTGTDAVIRSHPNLISERLSYVTTFCMLPSLLVVLASQLLPRTVDPLTWAMGLALLGVMLSLTIMIEYQQVPLTPAMATGWRRPWQQLLGYGLVLALFMMIYQTRSRAAISATSVAIVSSMVAVTLLRQSPQLIHKSWLYATIIGLGLGQVTWALNYWRTSTLHAALFLFLIFYVSVGLAHQQLLGKFSRRILWEFGAVAIVTLFVIFRW